VLIDLQQRELLAQLVLVPVVCVNVDRLSKEKRFVESVELLLDRLRLPFNVSNVAKELSLALLPRTQHMLFHEPHVARRRLQLFQLVGEQSFQLRFGHVHGAALAPAVVVRVANSAAATYQTVDALISSLDPNHEYPLTRLVYPPPSDEPLDTQPKNSWGWLVGLILAAAVAHEERIVPDVAIMVGDTTSGFRSGNFEDRYKLKRDWVTEIFGDRTPEMLQIFAGYSGKNEYALGAKVASQQWLDEPKKPDA
jgi:hypothetical protein